MCPLERWVSPIFKQIWVVSSNLFMMIGHGMTVGVTSSMVPELQAPDSHITINLEQISWISASVGIGATVTHIASSFLMATFGRRGSMLIGLVPCIISLFICYFCSDVNVLIFGRFVTGLGLGATSIVGLVIIGEYTSPKYRGVFLNFKSAALFFGSMISHTLGNYFHWRTVMLAITVPFIISFGMTYIWPESPAWLAANSKYDECSEAFYWLRGRSEQSTRELRDMIKTQRELYKPDKIFMNRLKIFLNKFRQRNFLKPLGIYLFAAILLEVSGRHIFSAYALQIVKQVNSDQSNNFYYTLCIDLIMSVSAIVSTVLVKIMKRRTLLFSSGVSSVIVLLAVCVYYYLQSKSMISKSYDTLALLLFGVYFVFTNVGCMPICLTLIGEIFPLEHRPTAVSMAGTLVSIVMFIMLKITPIMLVTIKVYGTFAVFGMCMAVCLLVLYLTLPETKDKTLQEIEDYFNCDSSKNNDDKLSVEEEAMLAEVDSGVKTSPHAVSSFALGINFDERLSANYSKTKP